MDSKTFYLKYRPQRLTDLDLDEIRERLIRLIKSKKIPHALLFAGPKGIGKTSAARVLAKAINCPSKKKNHEPCNRCVVCQEITNGTSLDLIEIDAASNRGIDDIRALREKIKLAPVKCQYKVYIIDEVHMLTAEAFNALLKTLEEPPAHAVFILCTTDPEKLPGTIISRCTRFNFNKAKLTEVINALKRAVRGEKLQIEKGGLEAIAKAVDGSFRDAHKLLEQLSLDSKKISLKKTKKFLQQTDEFLPNKLLSLVIAGEIKLAFQEIDRVVSSGANLMVYTQAILDSLRRALLVQVGVDNVIGPEETAGLDIFQIRQLIELFSQAAKEIKSTSIPQLPLELAVVEFTPQSTGSGSKPTSGPASSKPIASQPKSGNGGNVKQVEAKWSEILTQVKPLNHSVEALLRASRPLGFKDKTLTLEVFYKFHKERLETPKCRSIVEEVCTEVMGSPIRVCCVLGEKKPQSQAKTKEMGDIVDIASQIFNS